MNYINKEDCTGCTACFSICPVSAISMEKDKEGFLYPEVDTDKCIECGLCEKVCPITNNNNAEKTTKNTPKKIYALKHKDDKVRKSSASGGAYTAITDYMFERNPDSTICYGASYTEYHKVVHLAANEPYERNKFRGSKYIQSDLGNTFRNIKKELKDGKSIIFTGTPCQVDGLKNFLKLAEVDMKNLILNDLICHGVPSPMLWKDYIDFLEITNKSKLQTISTRTKVDGWRQFAPIAEFENGKIKNTTPDVRTFLQLFYSRLALRPACYECKYSSIQRTSDITIADFWGIEHSHPEFYDDLGVSLVLANTEKGEALINETAKYAEILESDLNNCIKYQHNLQEPTPKPPNRDAMWNDYYRNGFKYVAIKYLKYSMFDRGKNLVKRILTYIGIIR